jgi:hypothetical protein
VTTSLEVVALEPTAEQLRYSFGAGEPTTAAAYLRER